jgi:hypothetical protein
LWHCGTEGRTSAADFLALLLLLLKGLHQTVQNTAAAAAVTTSHRTLVGFLIMTLLQRCTHFRTNQLTNQTNKQPTLTPPA